MTDYIRRDEALSFPFANGHYDHKNANEHFIYGCESYREWLENLPTADVRENVHAHWIDDLVAFHRVCPICRCCVRATKTEVFEGDGDLNFCPNCGAIMDGGDEH